MDSRASRESISLVKSGCTASLSANCSFIMSSILGWLVGSKAGSEAEASRESISPVKSGCAAPLSANCSFIMSSIWGATTAFLGTYGLSSGSPGSGSALSASASKESKSPVKSGRFSDLSANCSFIISSIWGAGFIAAGSFSRMEVTSGNANFCVDLSIILSTVWIISISVFLSSFSSSSSMLSSERETDADFGSAFGVAGAEAVFLARGISSGSDSKALKIFAYTSVWSGRSSFSAVSNSSLCAEKQKGSRFATVSKSIFAPVKSPFSMSMRPLTSLPGKKSGFASTPLLATSKASSNFCALARLAVLSISAYHAKSSDFGFLARIFLILLMSVPLIMA